MMPVNQVDQTDDWEVVPSPAGDSNNPFRQKISEGPADVERAPIEPAYKIIESIETLAPPTRKAPVSHLYSIESCNRLLNIISPWLCCCHLEKDDD